MAKAKYAKTISAHVPISLIPSIDALCEKHGASRSKILGYIVTAWYRAGCPTPTQLDVSFFESALKPSKPPFHHFPEAPLGTESTISIAAESPASYEPAQLSPDEILAERLKPRSRSATSHARSSDSSASA